jgi:hypothetical protein
MNEPIKPALESDAVVIIGASPTGEGLVEHGPVDRVIKSVGQLKDSYQRVVGQILTMTEETPQDGSLRLKTIEVGLGFTGEGELGFIATAKVGVEATVSLTFERA